MKSFLKFLGYLFASIAVIGSGRLIATEGLNKYTFLAALIYILLSVLCFRGARTKKNDEDSNK